MRFLIFKLLDKSIYLNKTITKINWLTNEQGDDIKRVCGIFKKNIRL